MKVQLNFLTAVNPSQNNLDILFILLGINQYNDGRNVAMHLFSKPCFKLQMTKPGDSVP